MTFLLLCIQLMYKSFKIIIIFLRQGQNYINCAWDSTTLIIHCTSLSRAGADNCIVIIRTLTPIQTGLDRTGASTWGKLTLSSVCLIAATSAIKSVVIKKQLHTVCVIFSQLILLCSLLCSHQLL